MANTPSQARTPLFARKGMPIRTLAEIEIPIQARNADSVRLIGEERSARMNESAIPRASRETIIWGVYSGFTGESYKVQSAAKSAPARMQTRIQMRNHEFEAGGST